LAPNNVLRSIRFNCAVIASVSVSFVFIFQIVLRGGLYSALPPGALVNGANIYGHFRRIIAKSITVILP
jgi:hypothetical protein